MSRKCPSFCFCVYFACWIDFVSLLLRPTLWLIWFRKRYHFVSCCNFRGLVTISLDGMGRFGSVGFRGVESCRMCVRRRVW